VESLEDRRLLATFVVTNLGDLDPDENVIPGTLRNAIELSNANDTPNIQADTIVFSDVVLAQGASNTINLNGGVLEITGPLTILGPSAKKLTVVGPATDRVFTIDDGDDNRTAGVTIGGLTITGGSRFGDGMDNYGGAIFSKERLTVIESILTGNAASSGGGAIAIERGSATITRSLIQGNSSGGSGGGILNGTGDSMDLSPRITIQNSTITGNSANGGMSYGGGVFNRRGRVDVLYSTFVGNSAGNESYLGFGIGSQGNPPPEEEGGEPPAPVVFTYLGGSIIHDGADDIIAPENEDDPELLPSIVSNGYNIASPVSTAAFIGPGDSKGDPGLISDPLSGMPILADYGGIHDVFLPDVGSPAIDKGNPMAGGSFENRGRHFTRIYDYTMSGTPVIDIGATERQLGQFVVDELYDESDLQFTGTYFDDPIEGVMIFSATYDAARDFTLREAMDFSRKNPDLDTILFSPELVRRPDPAPFTSPPTLVLSAGEIGINHEVIITGPTTYELEVDVSASDPSPSINNSDGARIFMITDGDATNDVPVVISSLTLRGGDVVNSGGAIHNSENLTLDRLTFRDNAASNDGGALFIQQGNVTISNTTFTQNFAADDGGGIYVVNAATPLGGPWKTTISNSTISGNTAGDRGAGILNANGDVKISYSTITNNQSASLRGSGLISGVGGTPNTYTHTEVRSTIISGNGNNDVEQFGLSGNTIVSLGYNFVGNGNASALFNATGDINGQTNPMLKPLARTGGLVLTHEPQTGSPVIDAGDPAAVAGVGDVPLLDQRGLFYQRVVDGNDDAVDRIDIGAYELQGVTYIVNTINDENDGDYSTPAMPNPFGPGLSLREAIELSNASPLQDFIEFDASLLGLTMFMSSVGFLAPFSTADLRITDDVVITGPGSSLLTINVSGAANMQGIAQRAFTVDNGQPNSLIDVTISGLDLINSRAQVPGGTIFSRENLTLDDIFWVNNSTFGDAMHGGVIYQEGGSLKLNNSTITGSSTEGVNSNGGAIYGLNTDMTISYSTIAGNTTARTQADGGGIYVRGSNLTLDQTTLTGNSTPGGASDGGGFFARDSVVVANESIVAGNVTTGSNSEGGGFYSLNSSVTFNNSTLSINSTIGTTSSGGGAFINGGSFLLNDSLVSQNFTQGLNAVGGGIANAGGVVQLNRTTVVGNRTTGTSAHGAGVHNLNGSLTVTDSTLRANLTQGPGARGAGIYSHTGGSAATTRIVNSTLSGNVTADHGGGLYNRSGTTVIQHSTITENSAPFFGFGGGINSYGGSAAQTRVKSSIVAGNLGSDVDIFGGNSINTFVSEGYNLIGNGLSKNAFSVIGDRIDTGDPLLGPLADNGGGTFTHLPMAGSLAINAGNPAAAPGLAGVPQFDQRGTGFSRVRGGRIDIGAVETALSGFAADFDGDDDVDGFDFLAMQRGFGKPEALPMDGDTDLDRDVDDTDVANWAAQFGSRGESLTPPGGTGGVSSESFAIAAAHAPLSATVATDVAPSPSAEGAETDRQALARIGRWGRPHDGEPQAVSSTGHAMAGRAAQENEPVDPAGRRRPARREEFANDEAGADRQSSHRRHVRQDAHSHRAHRPVGGMWQGEGDAYFDRLGEGDSWGL
jgi:predicted outer membrane repeat protein